MYHVVLLAEGGALHAVVRVALHLLRFYLLQRLEINFFFFFFTLGTGPSALR